jgi:hypothetical protein
MRIAYKISVGKYGGKRPLGRPRHRLKIILEWILRRVALAQDRDQ